MASFDEQLINKQIDEFRYRAKNLRRTARFNLVIIIFTLLTGVVIFATAELLSTQASQNLEDERISLEEEKLNKERKALYESANIILDGMNVVKESLKFQNELNEQIIAGAARDENYGRLATVMSFNNSQIKIHDSKIDLLEEKLNQLEIEKKRLESENQKLKDSNVQSKLDQNQIFVLISSAFTRIGSIIILLFLVKILIPLYKYNIKLASYYDARADALKLLWIDLSGGDPLNTFIQLTPALTPQDIDFSKAPETPTEQTIQLLKYVIDSQKKK